MAAVTGHGLLQWRHSLLANSAVTGHGRYLVEAVGRERGVEDASRLDTETVEFLHAGSTGTTRPDLYRHQPGWRRPSPERPQASVALMLGTAPRGGSAPPSPPAAD